MGLIRSLQRFVSPKYWKRKLLISEVLKVSGNRVLTGPFAGMKYVNESIGSRLTPKLLGTYEKELHQAVEELIADQPVAVLNVGAAEGYYGVGFALRLPRSKVVVWESSSRGRELIKLLARSNGIGQERFSIHGICTLSELRETLSKIDEEHALLVVDIEGGEALLLDPECVPALVRCALLVEIHEFAIEGVETLIVERFSKSHVVSRIEAQNRSIDDWPHQILPRMPPGHHGAAVSLMDEGRSKRMSWFLMQPREFK